MKIKNVAVVCILVVKQLSQKRSEHFQDPQTQLRHEWNNE